MKYFHWTNNKECFFSNADADRNTVFSTLRKHMFSHKVLDRVYIYYNGHGSVNIFFKFADQAGRMICANEETIGLDEILRVI